MNLYHIKNNKVDFIGINPFKKEKEIQETVEKNTEPFFGLEFVRSEFYSLQQSLI